MKNIIKVLVLGLLVGLIALPNAYAQQENSEPLTITEYADYQCPACAYYHNFVERLKEDLGDQIEFEMRYFPLANHQHAALTARAAQAAKNQGKFQEMHALLYENQQEWTRAANAEQYMMRYAREIDLDIDQFREDLNAGETQNIVMEQKQEGLDRGVNATPTFYVEGEKINRLPQQYEQFKSIIESYLNES